MTLSIVPVSFQRASEYVERFHRHHGRPLRGVFSIGAAEDGELVGVALVGRPAARLLDDGWTLEVNRLCTNGAENACSALYGAARRAAKALGYARLITYIRSDEPGTSLRASGWTCEGDIRARSWNMPGRPRTDKTEIVRRQRWSVDLGAVVPFSVPEVESRQGMLL